MSDLPVTGAAGVAPPPDAPTLPTQPLQADAGAIVVAADIYREGELVARAGDVISPIERARQNERTLAPLDYGAPKPTAVVGAVIAGKASDGLDPFYAELEKRNAVAVPPTVPAPVDRSLFPAGSNTDSPSRGVPRPIGDLGKQITGGFGAQPNEYFPLTGVEVKTVIEQLLDELHAQLQNDLRFHIATCYPRLSAKLSLIVTCAVQDAPVQIEKVFTHDQTPLAVAESLADTACFVISKARSEVAADGSPQTPADALRQELDLPVPRKRQLANGMSVDTIF